MLSGLKIEEELGKCIHIVPFKRENLNPNSYDLTLDNILRIYERGVLDVKHDNPTRKEIIPESGYRLLPGILYLGSTVETTETIKYIPMIEGKSSLARLGISIHATAGFGDIGFCGKWTLEISVIHPVIIYPFMKIAQIYFDSIEGPFELYKGKYQHQGSAVPSQSWRDFT
jgi:dCTP deaminase